MGRGPWPPSAVRPKGRVGRGFASLKNWSVAKLEVAMSQEEVVKRSKVWTL